MNKKHEVTAKCGRLRLRCERCEVKKYHVIPSRMRRKTVRCHCGKVAHLTINRRKYRRESCVGRAVAISAVRKIQVNLCNISQTGVGFTVKKATRLFKINQKITIEYKAFSGRRSIRKVVVTNIATDHVGVRYADKLL